MGQDKVCFSLIAAIAVIDFIVMVHGINTQTDRFFVNKMLQITGRLDLCVFFDQCHK